MTGPEPEHGIRWWLRYVAVPLLGSGGVVAVIVALIGRPSGGQLESYRETGAAAVKGSLDDSVVGTADRAQGAAYSQTFKPPTVTWAPEGWQDYVDAVVYDTSNVKGLYPGPVSPEAAVVHAYASLLRGDTRFRDVLAPDKLLPRDVSPDDRNYSFIENITWTIRRFKLHKRAPSTGGQVWIQVWLEVEHQGEIDEGTDEVDVRLLDGKWYVVRLPT